MPFRIIYTILTFNKMIDRIILLKKHLGLSTRAFAIKCGMNQPTLDRMLNGVNALNLNCIVSILSTFPMLSAEWLLRGNGDMYLKQTDLINNDSNDTQLIEMIRQKDIIIRNDAIEIGRLKERLKQLENKFE